MFGLLIMTRKRYEKLLDEFSKMRSSRSAQDFEHSLLIKQMDIATLQSQINPHFLYNTLDCIRGQALKEGSTAIADIAYALSRFFRYNISGSNSMVPLQDELDNVKNYFTIQKYRFGNRFNLEILNSDKSLYNILIPKMCLQPIVENCIVHGLSDTISGGKITILIRKIDSLLSITISDNGKGMDTSHLSSLNDKIHSDNFDSNNYSSNSTGIGLWNVNRRIALYFGPEYGLNVHSCQNVGTDVEIYFPHTFTEHK